MDIKIKALLILAPVAFAGYAGFAVLPPLMEDDKNKGASIEEKARDRNALADKLKNKQQVSDHAIQLKADIEKLRDSVPKAPDIDLLNIDLEKMCKDAGMNFVALTAPKEEATAAKPKTPEESAYTKKDKLKNMLKGGGAGAPAETAAGGEAKPEAPELETTRKLVTLTGDFIGLQKFVHDIETYQRVVRIDELTFHLSKKRASGKEAVKVEDAVPSEGEDGDSKLLFITMTLTTYFLP